MKRFLQQKAQLVCLVILSIFISILSGCGGGGGGHWNEPVVIVVSISVTPPTSTIPVSGTQQFTAIANFSDGSSRDVTASSTWTSANLPLGGAAVATVSSSLPTKGLATGNVVGQSAITASFGGKSDSATLTVNAATFVSFVIKPALASIPVTATQQYTAIETFSDGTSFDRTTVSAWTSPDLSGGPGVATIGANTGLATGHVPGTSTITAVYNGHTATATLTVNAATFVSFVVRPATATIPVSGAQQYTAIETFSDGTSFDRTAVSAWSSGTPAVGIIGPSTGLAQGVSPGTSTITAIYNGHTGTATLNVTAALPAAACGSGPLPLGSAASFAILAGTALTITNPMFVTGDVGSPSITPASGPSSLVGTMFDSSPASELTVIANAVADMGTAVDCAVARTCDFNYLAGHDFGGDVLAPGVHCVPGAMTVGSNLTFSTPGVYIFRATGGAFTSAATITVGFGGTANATNTSVYWVADGATSIGANNGFVGTIMSKAGAITVGAVTTLAPGRVLSGAAATVSTNTITKPTP